MKNTEISEIKEITERTPLSLFFNPNTARQIYSQVKFVNALPSSLLSKQSPNAEAPTVVKGQHEPIPEPRKK